MGDAPSKVPSDRPWPIYVRDSPVMGAAFMGLVSYLWEQPDAHEAFCKATGMPRLARDPLEVLIDEAARLTDGYAVAFLEWVIRDYWGEDGTHDGSSPKSHGVTDE